MNISSLTLLSLLANVYSKIVIAPTNWTCTYEWYYYTVNKWHFVAVWRIYFYSLQIFIVVHVIFVFWQYCWRCGCYYSIFGTHLILFKKILSYHYLFLSYWIVCIEYIRILIFLGWLMFSFMLVSLLTMIIYIPTDNYRYWVICQTYSIALLIGGRYLLSWLIIS